MCYVEPRVILQTTEKNKLYYGDNYEVLKRYVRDESVDLVYLDPPFNSRQDYNVLFAEKDGSKSSSQIHAFEDTWEWNLDAERSYQHILENIGGRVADVMRAFRTFLGNTDMMAYLAMMAPRLIELKRVLKETGSIYVHCDPTASHYLKVLMDAAFGPQQFVNEITWKRTIAHSDAKQGRKAFGNVADILLFYSRGTTYVFNHLYSEYSEGYLKKYSYIDADGRRYRLDNLTGPGGAAKGNPQYEVMGVTRFWRYSATFMPRALLANLNEKISALVGRIERNEGRSLGVDRTVDVSKVNWHLMIATIAVMIALGSALVTVFLALRPHAP
jgi:adenine specific DNA methylase Mod